MATVSRLKRRLVRDVVRHNVDLAEGRGPAKKLRRLHQRRQLGWWVATLSAVAVILAVGWLVMQNFGSADPRTAEGAVGPAGNLLAAPLGSVPLGSVPLGSVPVRVAQEQRMIEPEVVELTAVAERMARQVLPLAVRRVIVDPGHGGEATGTRAALGVVEKEVVLDLAMRLRTLLQKSGFEVLMTRETDVAVDLQERARIANEAHGDLFVSIHINWISDRSARGVETYYLGASDDPHITALAAAENRDSGYSLADMRHLLDRIYTGVRINESQALARKVQASLFGSLSEINPQLADRGVKRAPFIVLIDTHMPAILAEVSCLSNEREARLLQKPLYRQFIAEALAEGVRSYSGVADPVEQKGS